MTKIPNLFWSFSIGICDLFVISPSESPPSGRGPVLVLGIWKPTCCAVGIV